MPTPAQLAIRKGAAVATINAHSAELAALSGLTAVTLHADAQHDDPQTVELLEVIARLAAALAATNP